ncbi:MAG: chorismate synthase [Eubacteriales bacterium]
MFGSTLGSLFKISTWGESHGTAIGVVIDGCPAGLSLCEEDIQLFLNRRKPGQSKFTTQRKESDTAHILSGVFDGKTTGTPISVLVQNQDQRSKDYGDIASYYRPGHADYTYDQKYGFRDYRGGGRSSGRETISRVIAGAIASKLLGQLNIELLTYTKSIGPIAIKESNCDYSTIEDNPLYMPDPSAAKEAATYLESCMNEKDSSGGIIECQINHMPVGIGEPCFEKLSANLAKAVCSIGSVKGFELGDGFQVATMMGSENNDQYSTTEDGQIVKETNHAGGILGGISDGSTIILRVAIKPTPSIASTQHTLNQLGNLQEISIQGRHDPVIVPRAVVVVESMVAITILDLLLGNMTSQLDGIKNFYKK